MRRLSALVGLAGLAAIGATLAIAQEDPIAAVINKAPEQETPPPPPAEVPAAVAASPEPKVEPKVTPTPTVATKPAVVTQTRRPRYPIAILQAMDKITAESIRFEARVDKPVSYKGLVFTVRACETTAADEPVRDAVANVEIAFRPPAPPRGKPPGLRQVYRGWMFAASPSIAPLEHPVYDAWLIACKADGPVAPAVLVQAPITSPGAIPKVEPRLGPSPAAPKAKVEGAPAVVAPAVVAPPPVIAPPPPAAPKVEAPKAEDRVILY